MYLLNPLANKLDKKLRENERNSIAKTATLEKRIAELEDNARCINIMTEGRLRIFTFIRNGQTFNIETYGTLGDDVKGWKRKLGLSA